MELLSPEDAFKYQNHDPDLPVKKWDGPIVALAVFHLIKGSWLFCLENQVLWHYLWYSTYDDPKTHVWGPPLPTVALGNLVALVIIVAGIGL